MNERIEELNEYSLLACLLVVIYSAVCFGLGVLVGYALWV